MTFHSSKSKLGDSEASAREKTNGAELFRSKHGTSKGLHASFKLKSLPLPPRKALLSTASMLLPENLVPRRKTPPRAARNISSRFSDKKATASLAEKIGRPSPSPTTSIAARRAPIPVPATMSKKSTIRAFGSPVFSRIWFSRWTRAAPATTAEVPPPSMLRTAVFFPWQWYSHFCSSLEKISRVALLSSMQNKKNQKNKLIIANISNTFSI
ncbi:checkpoint protein kinase [Striga asiatica]|uniref:Checkpoint protein kinase n=1 Tax=Striga asiatica TaxID=4170 RepID=A0A5A7REQ4_STRAF|nr:checkpoint protein kinase [Striga asiatica]